MSKDIEAILQALAEFKNTPLSAGLGFRLNVAGILLRGLKNKGWTQSELASAASLSTFTLSKIVHCDMNCSLDTVAKLFRALGIEGRIVEVAAT